MTDNLYRNIHVNTLEIGFFYAGGKFNTHKSGLHGVLEHCAYTQAHV